MKKVALVVALLAAIGFVSHVCAEPASAFLFGGGSSCGGGGPLFGGLFKSKAPTCGVTYGGYGCYPYYGCAYPACAPPCKIYKKRAKAGAAPATAPKAKKTKKK